MSYTIVGYCQVCAAPMHVPTMWMGIYPPVPQASCACAQRGQFRGLMPSHVNNPFIPKYPNPFIAEQPQDDWKSYTVPPNRIPDAQAWEQYRQHLNRSADNEGVEWTPPKKTISVQEKIAETRKVVENIRTKQRQAEAAKDNDLSGIETLGKALTGEVKEERLDDLEERMDRLETMMVTTAKNLAEIKALIKEARDAERAFADDGK